MPSTVIRRFAYDVPQPVVEAFRGAISKGRYFNTYIRDRFAFSRISGS